MDTWISTPKSAKKLTVKSYLYDVFLPLFDKEALIQTLYESIGSADPNDYDKILNKAHRLEEELIQDNFLCNIINYFKYHEWSWFNDGCFRTIH